MKNRILLIDDDPTLLDLLSQYLASAGYQVFAAPNGSIGLKLAYNEHPDLVLLDVMLPGMDGWEICARLREMTAVPIVRRCHSASESNCAGSRGGSMICAEGTPHPRSACVVPGPVEVANV